MTAHDLAGVVGFYADALREHGDGPRAVGWDTEHGQQAAFLQLARVEGLTAGVRVLDVGCGLGHLLDFFERIELEVEYTGYDICAPLVEQARARHPGARFEHRDLLADPPTERFDIVIASGVFGVAPPEPEPFVADLVRAMFACCDRALAFNMLSAPYFQRHPLEAIPETYYYADPGLVLNTFLELTPQVTLDHTDIGEQFAVFLYRENTASARRLIDHLKVAPDDAFGPAHRAVIEHFTTLEMRHRAIEYLEGLPESAAVHDAIGLLAFERGDQARQLSAWQRACELAPDSPAMLERLGIAYEDAERLAEAAACFERAVALAPGDANLADRLAAVTKRARRE